MSVFYIMLMLPTALEKLTQNQNQKEWNLSSVKRVYSKRMLGSILIRGWDNRYFTDSGDCA